MALVLDVLKTGLEQTWLVPEGGQFPQSTTESGDRFASAVVQWFSLAMANGIPCSTATARKSQLASAAAGAFSANSAPAAGSQLALGVAAYIAGQTFGAGVASFPVATSAAVVQMTATFTDLNGSISSKAQQIAAACTLLATSTIVIFPPPMTPTPIV